MTAPPTLLPLALQAIDDPDARVVLADALLESGWWDERVWTVLYGPHLSLVGINAESLRRTWITLSSDRLPLAVAAVLLFGDWQTTRWSGVPWVPGPELGLTGWWRAPFGARRPLTLAELRAEVGRLSCLTAAGQIDEIRQLVDDGRLTLEDGRRLLESLPGPTE